MNRLILNTNHPKNEKQIKRRAYSPPPVTVTSLNMVFSFGNGLLSMTGESGKLVSESSL
jgi:hypothetical protein